MKLLNIPDPYPNAIRIAVAVFVACGIGYGVVLPSEGLHVTYARQFSQASKWAAITCVVVNAPVRAICMALRGRFPGFLCSTGNTSWTWLNISVLLAQVIGKVAQTGAERIIGTVTGGTLGFITYKAGRLVWDEDTRSDG